MTRWLLAFVAGCTPAPADLDCAPPPAEAGPGTLDDNARAALRDDLEALLHAVAPGAQDAPSLALCPGEGLCPAETRSTSLPLGADGQPALDGPVSVVLDASVMPGRTWTLQYRRLCREEGDDATPRARTERTFTLDPADGVPAPELTLPDVDDPMVPVRIVRVLETFRLEDDPVSSTCGIQVTTSAPLVRPVGDVLLYDAPEGPPGVP